MQVQLECPHPKHCLYYQTPTDLRCHSWEWHLAHYLTHQLHLWNLRPFGFLMYQIVHLTNSSQSKNVLQLSPGSKSFLGLLMPHSYLVASSDQGNSVSFQPSWCWTIVSLHAAFEIFSWLQHFHARVWVRHGNQRPHFYSLLLQDLCKRTWNVELPCRFCSSSLLFLQSCLCANLSFCFRWLLALLASGHWGTCRIKCRFWSFQSAGSDPFLMHHSHFGFQVEYCLVWCTIIVDLFLGWSHHIDSWNGTKQYQIS